MNEGYYVMGQYTSTAWFKQREDAEKEVERIKRIGTWSGTSPRVESGKKDGTKVFDQKGKP